MSESESEKDNIIKQARELIKDNEDTNFLTEDQKKEVSVGLDSYSYDVNKSPSDIYSMDTKSNQIIIYNIIRKNNKIAEMNVLAKALDILQSRNKLIKSQITKIKNKWFKIKSYDNELQNLNTQETSNTFVIDDINKQLNIYESLKTGGKRKTKKYIFRRHKSKKNKKLKLKN
jgi:hypothetical protein